MPDPWTLWRATGEQRSTVLVGPGKEASEISTHNCRWRHRDGEYDGEHFDGVATVNASLPTFRLLTSIMVDGFVYVLQNMVWMKLFMSTYV